MAILTLAAADGFLGFSGAGGWNLRNVGLDAADVQLFADLRVHLCEDVLVLLEETASVFSALADALAGVAVPSAGLLHDVVGHGQIEHVALAADALAVEDVELRLAEGSGHLVLDDLDLGAVAGDRVAFLDGGDAANVYAHRRVELECAAAGGGLRVAEHDADLFADLIDKSQRRSKKG